MSDIIVAYRLNADQTRAFLIIAERVINPKAEPLHMYLGGIAGTGKTQVIKALVAFFEKRDEAYRFLILAPTGSAACNVGGYTYHSVLCLRRGGGDGSSTDPRSGTRVRERLAMVDIIFIDEISMVSCSDLQTISAQICKAFDMPLISFAGKHVILAGDFAQLPPAGPGHYPLYSGSVGQNSSALTETGQRNALGKFIWHGFNTVVILRQNMRQRGISPGNQMFRTALENLRYKSCTSVDIALFRSRISSTLPGRPHLTEHRFRNVSIITAFNAHRDAINALGEERFAQEMGQVLSSFYSRDRLSRPRVQTTSMRRTQKTLRDVRDVKRRTNALGPKLRDLVWSLSPTMTEQFPGVLRLCPGMPVMLKNNEATELCATNGAEGEVVGWDVEEDTTGHKRLQTLFVRLVNPAKDVQISGLDRNVVPVTPMSEKISCTLHDDSQLTVTREQIAVLTNFSMSDYVAQGRTRSVNVVDIKYSRNFQSVYTSLSRSASLEDTLILQPFDHKKLTGGLPEDIRSEFISLEILDDITKLAFEGSLPGSVCGSTRKDWLATYREWKGVTYVPPAVHPALDWSKLSEEQILGRDKTTSWTPAVKGHRRLSRQHVDADADPRGNKRRRHALDEAPGDSMLGVQS